MVPMIEDGFMSGLRKSTWRHQKSLDSCQIFSLFLSVCAKDEALRNTSHSEKYIPGQRQPVIVNELIVVHVAVDSRLIIQKI